MTENVSCDAPKINGAKNSMRKFKALVLLGATTGFLVLGAQAKAAIDLNATIGPVLDSVAALVPSLVNMIIAIVPAVIIMAVIGFVIGFLDRVLDMLHIK